jgi:hypothetical protein
MTTDRFGPRVAALDDVPYLFAVGDVQGNGPALVELLRAAGLAEVADAGSARWIGGRGVLLFLGDLLDGGSEPALVLDTYDELARQAAVSGGQVVLLRGNHEQLLLEALAAPSGRSAWFANGGLETMARLAVAAGGRVSEAVVAAAMAPAFSDLQPVAEEIQALVALVEDAYAPVLARIRTDGRAAALVNGSLLAVHGEPNFEASSMEGLAPDEAAEQRMAWGRSMARTPGDPELAARLRDLKRRLDRPAENVCLRYLLFAHTVQDAFRVAGVRDQFRVGRVLEGELSVFNLMTAPRRLPETGALGGLLLDSHGVAAVYGREIHGLDRRWPAHELFEAGDSGFPGSPAASR